MKGKVRYLAIAVGATLAFAYGGWEDTAGNGFGSGSIDKEITISGCVTRVPHDLYVLTSIDDLAGQYRGTAGRGQDDSEQNPSAAFGRYLLTGSSDQFVSHVDREVEVKGQVLMTDNGSEALRVGSMRSTGRKCSKQ